MTTWDPTHVQFTVLRARNLISKGKGGNNDVFVTIQLGKEKYQTSTIKNAQNPEWFEECELPIPSFHSEIEVVVYHRGVLADDFLGYAAIAINDYKVGERPKSKWVTLQQKPNKPPDGKVRGELEVKLTYHVKSQKENMSGLKKRSSSIRSLATAMGDKLKLSRSKSFRENRRDPEGGKSDKRQSGTSVDLPQAGEAEPASSGLSNFPAHSNTATLTPSPLASFPALDVDHKHLSGDPGEGLTRSYSLSAAYVKSLSMDRGRPVSFAQALQEHGTDDSRSKSLYNIPGNRRSCFEFLGDHIPPPPYESHSLAQDDLMVGGMGAHGRGATPRSQASSSSNYLNYRRDRAVCESIKERTEDGTSSSDDPMELARRPMRPVIKVEPKDTHRDFDADSESGEEAGATGTTVKQVGRDEEGAGLTALIEADPRQHKAAEVAELNRMAPERLSGSSGRKRIIPERRDGFPVPLSSSTPRENGHIPVVHRRKPKRDKLRMYKTGGRRYTVQGLDYRQGAGLYDDSLSDLSDSAKNHREPLPDDLVNTFRTMGKEELVRMVIQHKAQMIRKDQYIRDLENYIDDLLVRVMETTPKLLQRSQHFHRF